MRRCSRSGALVPLFVIRLRTSSPPALFPASSLAFPLTRVAGGFTTPPRTVFSPLGTSRLTSQFPFTGPTPSGVSQVDPLPDTVPVEVAVGSGAARGAASGGAASGGAEPGGAGSEGAWSGGAEPGDVEPGGAEPGGAEPGGAEPEGAESGGAETRAAGAGDSATGGTGAGGVKVTRLGGAGVTARAGGTGGATAAGPGGAHTTGLLSLGPHLNLTTTCATILIGGAGAGARAGDPAEPGGAKAGGTGAGGAEAGAGNTGAVGTGAGGTGAGGVDAGDTGAIDPGAGGAGAGGAVSGGTGAGGTVRPRPYFVPLLQQTGGLTEHREPESRPTSPVRSVRTGRRVPRPRPPPVPGTHAMALRPSSVPLRFPLPPPLEFSLPAVHDPMSDLARPASPIVSCLFATVVTDPSFESTAASAFVAELVDSAAACRLDYASAVVAESESATPPSVGGECALGTDVLEDRQEDFECLAAVVPCFASKLLAPEKDPDAPDCYVMLSFAFTSTSMDAEMTSWKSTGTYVDAVPPFGANIVDGMWIFRVKRSPGSPLAFKARYVARGFSQRQGVDYFQTFSPTPKMTTLRVLLHVAAHRHYELHSLDFSTAFLQGSLHEEIWLRRPLGFTGSFSAGTQWSLWRPVYGLRPAPREWHNTLRTTLVALGFTPSTSDPSLFLRTDTSLPPFYVLMYVDDLVFATADTEALTLVKSEL
ncbi:unnamed protein product [Closterium sp. NIES-54]